ncbi:MAG: nucleoside-diphosphate kinase [Bacteroidetes bacterium]|jgi:nucleoside-diphosphate kinase|nr:nucleoside-diphosphate kinase [Bacteroidota bacterium]MBT6685538.1 nucleoside-diphosphate kinase [Bacteroidota bacterium]MBT7143654.1 nucleoside-diphosphate kinase [Bacteroidota bacterium]MBT7491599.1 nucleoside-diphosphate kinase [Bacteroidota bacterium]
MRNTTFTMIKPSAIEKGYIGPILTKIEEAGFEIVALKMVKLRRHHAEEFYAEHEGKPFFEGLVEFMISGRIVAAILEKENAVADFRKLIGNTDPTKADEGTIRKLYAKSLQENAIHGSDSDESANRESDFFFSKRERNI